MTAATSVVRVAPCDNSGHRRRVGLRQERHGAVDLRLTRPRPAARDREVIFGGEDLLKLYDAGSRRPRQQTP